MALTATAQKIFPALKSTVRIKFPAEANQRDGGGEQHLIVLDSADQSIYSSYVKFTVDWSDVKQIVSAYLVLQTMDPESHGAGAREDSTITVARITADIPTPNAAKGEGVFVKGDYDPLPLSGTAPKALGSTDRTNGKVNKINITSLLEWEAPTTVLSHTGSKCPGHGPHYGFRIERRVTTNSPRPRMIVASEKHPQATSRPYIQLNYIAKPTPATVEQTAPAGALPGIAGLYFEADYRPSAAANTMSKYTVQLFKYGAGTDAEDLLWTSGLRTANATEIATNHIRLPMSEIGLTGSKYKLLVQPTEYVWRINVTDNKGVVCPWSNLQRFWLLTTAPILSSPTPVSTIYETLTGVEFGASYSDPPSNVLTALRFQFRSVAGDLIWDSDLLAPTADEKTSRIIRRKYGGPALPAGSYTWTLVAYDGFSAPSNTVGGSFTTTKDMIEDPGEAEYLTGYNRQRRRTRIVIRKVDTTAGAGRKPGTVVAIIEDASNIGASEFYNSGGEFFFTLSANHPQVPAIEPRQTHYALEQYRGQGWVEITAGLIVDFDASGDDIIFYGFDYLGVFGLLVDERFNTSSTADKTAVLWPEVGSGTKYSAVTIDKIVKDQLERAIHMPNSPLGFFTVGTISPMVEKVTIFTTFRERGPFVSGLLDSHRAGKGIYTRLRVRKTAGGGYQFVVSDTESRTRPALRMEYGGLVQDFRIIAFGDWGTAVHGVGMPLQGTETIYAQEAIPVPAGQPTDLFPKRYGSYPKARIYENVSDPNDLIRRTRQAARSLGKLGKRLSIGLRQDVLDVKDGWDITDSVPIHIDRGAVETLRMGSGYWTILGWSWQVRPDGMRNLVLSIQPRDDTYAPQADLIESVPIFSGPDWKVGIGPPTQDSLGYTGSIGKPPSTYVDSSTGEIYVLDMEALPDWDPTSGLPPPYINVTEDPAYNGVVVPTDDMLNKTTVGPTPPATPSAGDIWINDATDPSSSFIWDGTEWVNTGGVPAGTLILNGHGAPSVAEGEDGNYYLDVDSNTMYGPKDSTGSPVWPIAMSPGTGEQGPEGPPGPTGPTLYTWVMYATSATGAGITSNPAGMPYIGFAYNKTTATPSTNPADYAWSLIQGATGPAGSTGAVGPPGADGTTLYTWVKYADSAAGAGMSDDPTGKTYIGLAYNKVSAVESNIPTDYAWSLIKGADGAPGSAGTPGTPGASLYTWTKYANDAVGTGLSDDPTGKSYIGLAYNKTSAVESTVAADYTWSLILGPQGPTGPAGPQGTTGAVGPPGVDGSTLYTWTKYADNASGGGISDSPTGKIYIGLAFNKSTPIESNEPTDYAWSLIKGADGAPGSAGSTGPAGPTLYTWIKYATNAAGAGITDDPSGMTYIGFAYNKTTPTESNTPTDYTWSLIQGPTGPTGPQGPVGATGSTGAVGPPGPDGATLYTWTKYADDATGGGISDSPTNKSYIGLAFNKTTPVESNLPADYSWSLIKGDTGAPGSAGSTGPAGPTLYTWMKYASSATGAGLTDDPTGMSYIGFAYNKTVAAESTNPADYTWSLIQGPQGPAGPTGPTGPAGAVDTTPPPVVTIKTLVALEAAQQEDGTVVALLQGTVGYPAAPGITDLSEIVVQSTRYPRIDDPTQPDWTLATQWTVASTDGTGSDTVVMQPNVLAGETYWWRATATDVTGNRQPTWSAVVSVVAAADADGPPRVSGIVVVPGMSVIGVRWDPVAAPDFAYVEVQIRQSPSGNWVSVMTGGTIVVLTGLANDVVYDLRMRSVDTSGNTQNADGTSAKVTDETVGWVDHIDDDPTKALIQGTPTPVPGNALVWDSAIIEDIFAGEINADWIGSGTLSVGKPGAAAKIEVFDADGKLMGLWDQNGITILDPDPTTGASRYQMRINDASLVISDLIDPANPFDAVRITPLGIDAASVTFGSARGGHNLIPNSSFELGNFQTSFPTTVTSTWDTATEWNAAGSRQGTDINVTTGNSLTMTSVT